MDFSVTFEFIEIGNNRRLLMMNQYTFAPTSRGHYYCSKKGKGCKARIFLYPDGNSARFVANVHNHEPPVYKLMPYGLHVRIA